MYVPILPMILINGGLGIGTAFSCSVPMYNPLDIIECIRTWLGEERWKNEEPFAFPELTPWYNGFKGTVEKAGDHKFITKGIIDRKGDVVTVREIPVGMSIDGCQETIEELYEQKKIRSFQNYSSDVVIQFDIKENKDEEKELTLESLKLTSTLSTSNMVLFDEHGKIKKYNTISDILNEFCRVRYAFYEKRKAYMMNELQQLIRILQSKLRFLSEVMSGSLVIQNVPEETIIATLKKGKYQVVDGDDSYSYLLAMQIRSFSKQKVDDLTSTMQRYEKELKTLQATEERQLWMNDLSEFKKEYEKFK
jgi:DNA topoisomerase-2